MEQGIQQITKKIVDHQTRTVQQCASRNSGTTAARDRARIPTATRYAGVRGGRQVLYMRERVWLQLWRASLGDCADETCVAVGAREGRREDGGVGFTKTAIRK